ncbi:hypothetical protein AGMMS50276_09320 [Synergistales bacterium]|nr:hypothetical protein AGMMS50276_09320 [Synergistales bacterium]
MDSFIVTLSVASHSDVSIFEVDLEIPSHLPFSELKNKMLEILRILDNDKFSGCRDYRLEFKERAIANDETMARIGAFDGSVLRLYPIMG